MASFNPPCPVLVSRPRGGLLRRRGPELLAWLALLGLLVTAVPLFLCMPLCNDTTLWDLAARTVMRGGLLYRDLFETNLPGMLAPHVAVRTLFGWRWEALRAADLVMVGGIVWLLVRWVRPLGLSAAACVWTAVFLLLFYLSISEWSHCQRDMWMLLPSLGGLLLRRQQLAELTGPALSPRRLALRALAEGLCWGAAFWIKPFVAVPALACWLTSLLLMRRSGVRAPRLVILDAGCLLLGGLVVSSAAVLYLWGSGTWPYFWDVFTTWNPSYLTRKNPLGAVRIGYLLTNWIPWTGLHFLAVPIALVALLRIVVGRRDSLTTESVRREALLGAFYLGWWLQVLFLQKTFDYVFAPLILLAVALLAGRVALLHRSLPARAAVLAFGLVAVVYSPVFRPDRLALWGRCWTEGSTPEMHDRLQLTITQFTPSYVELAAVADYLRSRGVQDGELTCWANTTHPLYLELDVRPALPYMHVDQTLAYFPMKEELIRQQLAASHQRFVVSDLQSLLDTTEAAHAEQPEQPLALPPGFPANWADLFPWYEPVVFRSGRYLVHEVTRPPGHLLPPEKRVSAGAAGQGN